MTLVPVVAALVLGLVVIRFTDLKFLVAQHVLGVRDAQSVLVTRRSIRKFKKQAVPEAIVGRALAAAKHTCTHTTSATRPLRPENVLGP